MSIERTAWILAVALVTAACGGDAAGPPPANSSGGSMSARIDGSAWQAVDAFIAVQSTNVPGGMVVTGTSTGAARTISLALGRIPGPGTYPFGINIITGTGAFGTVASGAQSWSTPLSGAAGTLTITNVTDTRIAGTFSFDADASPAGGSAPISVTSGQFDVPRPAGFAPASAAELGSRVSATFDGAPWNAATVVSATGATFGASSAAYHVTLLGQFAAPGTYPIYTPAGGRYMTVQRIGANTFWGGSAADQGTITVTSLTATRVIGTFSGTLARTIGSGAPLVITNGSFDVRLGQP